MAEYTANAIQTVAVNQDVLFTDDPVPCNRGLVLHREGSGIITLRGIVNNCSGFARYKVSFGANLAIPTDGTAATPISLALSISGEPIPTSSVIVTPPAVDEYWNVYGSIFIQVPKNCCFNITVKNTSTIPINVQNANLIVERTA